MTDTASPSGTRPDEVTGPVSAADTRFGLLGPMEAVHKGVIREVPSGRQQALLAALLLRAGEVVSASMLMEQVWGESADRTVLNVCVMRLRRTLQDDGRDLIRADGNGYRVAVVAEAVDLHRFRRLCDRAGRYRDAGDRHRERDLLGKALALWRGEALSGIVSPMLQSEVVPILEEERLAAIEHRIDADLECGSHAEVIGELRQLVADHPFRERFWCQLLLALYRSGRQADALDAYVESRRRLTEELGVEPGDELRALHHRILTADPILLPPPSGPKPVTRVVPAQLPPTVAGFSGRGDQLRELDRLLDLPDPAPATVIMGPPGVGKTALAVHWASRHRERWSDGQLYIDLRGYGPEAVVSPIEALAYFLRAVGLPATQVPNDATEAAALFRSLIADRRLLLLLDNAATAEQVRPLLPGDGGCLVLVTSRDRLTGLVVSEGARRLALDVMADVEAESLLTDAVGAARLAAEPELVGELVRLCGNLPLALRITAAELIGHPERSLTTHVDELRSGNRLDALQLPEDEGTAVRAAFWSSYIRLPEPVRWLFRALGLFPGPEIDLASAAALAGTDSEPTRRSLDRLVSAHLLLPRGPDRFALHDLLRLFATELVHEADPEAARGAAVQRLYDHYNRTVEAAVKRLYPHTLRLPLSAAAARVPVHFDGDTAALNWLETERQNLVAAIQHGAEHSARLDASRLSAVLRDYLQSKRYLIDWLSTARAGLTAARAVGHRRAQIVAHLSLASFHHYRSQPRAAVRHFEQALAQSQHDGWIEGQVAAHNDLSLVYDLQGNLRLNAQHLYRALELNRRTKDATLNEAVILSNLSRGLLRMGQVADAVAHLERSSRLNNRLGSRVSEARSLSSLGEALGQQGEYERARKLLTQATRMQQELDDRQYLPNTLCRLARVHIDTGDYARAGELALVALALAREIHYRLAVPALLVTLADVDRLTGRHDSAIERYHQACRLAREVGYPYFHAQALIGLGTVHRELDQHGRARHHLDKAVVMARRCGFRLVAERAAATVAALPATDAGHRFKHTARGLRAHQTAANQNPSAKR